MDKYFENVCELDIMYNIEKAHYILDEMIMNGQIVETNKTLILAPLLVLDKITEWSKFVSIFSIQKGVFYYLEFPSSSFLRRSIQMKFIVSNNSENSTIISYSSSLKLITLYLSQTLLLINLAVTFNKEEATYYTLYWIIVPYYIIH